MTAPLLVFGYGNPSRGDDALGPLLLDDLAAQGDAGIELLTDFQLQVEHAADLEQRELVLFIDASQSCPAPFRFSRISPAAHTDYTTHAMTPPAILNVFERVYARPAPPAYLLEVRGERFELGEPLSEAAAQNRAAARELLLQLCARPSVESWRTLYPVIPCHPRESGG